MLTNQADPPAGRSAANDQVLETEGWEVVRQTYQTLRTSSLFQFTLARVEGLYRDLEAALYQMEHGSAEVSPRFLKIAESLQKARNELRLALFLFDVPEIDPLYRLVMRNRALLRGEAVLCEVIKIRVR
jgi:hypothetical protein